MSRFRVEQRYGNGVCLNWQPGEWVNGLAGVRARVCVCVCMRVRKIFGMLNTPSTLLMVTGVRNGCLRGFRLSPSHFKCCSTSLRLAERAGLLGRGGHSEIW